MRTFCGLLITLLIISCSRKTTPLVSSMHTEGMHHKWKIVSMRNATGALSAAYIDLRDVYHSGGTLGCRYFSFTPHYGYNNRMRMQDVSIHLAPCDTVEDNIFLEDLKLVTAFSLVGGRLKLTGSDGSLIFDLEKANDDENGSIKRKWLISEMINADNEQLIRDSAYLNFTDTNKSAGSVGCNSFSFDVVADNTYNISIRNIESTKIFCNDGAKNESVFGKMLPIVSKYQVIGNRIKLFDKDNVLLLEAIAPL